MSTPVWYTESLLLDLEDKTKKTDVKVYYDVSTNFKNAIFPHLKNIIWALSPKTMAAFFYIFIII